MKTIMENWNRFLKETDEKDALGVLSSVQKGQAEDVIKQLIALQLGTEAAAAAGGEGEGEEIDEGKATMRRRRKQERRERTKEIKKMAGLSGIKLTDFTPDQKGVYAQAKAAFKAKEQEDQEIMAATAAHNLSQGDLLKNPLAKKILDKLPDVVKSALLVAAGDSCAIDGAITLTCLMQGYASNFGMVEE